MPKGGNEYKDRNRTGDALKIKPMTVLVGSLIFIGSVIVLHIMGKLLKNTVSETPEDFMAE
jgi:hypothetical protein